jgi:hypothetical protein
MQGLGSARDSLLRHTSRPGLLVPGVLKSKGGLIEAVRCFQNGLILFEEIEHVTDHKANGAEGGLVLRCGLQLQHRRTHPPKQHLQRRREGDEAGASAMVATAGLSASALSRIRIPASCRIRPR